MRQENVSPFQIFNRKNQYGKLGYGQGSLFPPLADRPFRLFEIVCLNKRAVPVILNLLEMYQYLPLNIRYWFYFSPIHTYIYAIYAIDVGFTFLNLRMDVYSTTLVSWMDKELTDLWIPVPPFPLPAPLLMVSLPLPLPRPPWMESKHICKAAKSPVFFPAVANESSFSVLLSTPSSFLLLHTQDAVLLFGRVRRRQLSKLIYRVSLS